jgi:tetratricopeptide (TPR) repeat protein
LVLPWDLVAFSAIILIVITGVAIWQVRVRPWIAVGWLWYLGTLVPVIGLVQVGTQAMADRYTYVPMLGIGVALVWTARDLATRWSVPSPVCALGAIAAILASIVLTRAQIGYWKDSETLFRRTLEVTDHNAMAHVNLGTALGDRGARQEAIEQYQLALQIDPASVAAHLDLGMLLDMTGRPDEAVEHFRKAAELKPDFPQGYLYLGGVLARQTRNADAITAYRQALSLNSELAEAHVQLGLLYFNLARYDEAQSEFLEFLRLRPDSADAWNSVGKAVAAGGHPEQAISYFEKALQLQPNHEDARRNLGVGEAMRRAAPER